ncbi:23S rRNA (uracil(1939)-C(5))-methyltransferase RlmD [Agaribacter marinus]|uniref:23S rRNA (Uracil(1939)-C(5))-methyltransferase RlmD n=1 Tax=Agaribacter marinus TaxID=1431249 RepID=A0AA37WJW3_9ALTE|nr:23S rRNA (uracil(1939)-C(5))-methyltransferase RlmD [Agaribacter marinus]GLR72722.1 23S rRNA (uracil(1939)-C(5))-methyltransferase RlmD [Agaribacter marinus]
MVKIFKATPRKKDTRVNNNKPQQLFVDKLDYHGVGLCLSTKPITKIPGALANETVQVSVMDTNAKVNTAKLLKVVNKSDNRAAPFCCHYARCGGCSLQHLDQAQGLREKTKALQTSLRHHANLGEETWVESIESLAKYRRKVRLSIDARNLNDIRIGYRESSSKKIVDITECPILSDKLHVAVFGILPTLRSLKSVRNIGHLVFFESNDEVSLSVHCMKALRENDAKVLQSIATKLNTTLFIALKDKGIDDEYQHTLRVSGYQEQNLQQNLDVTMTDFVQVNDNVNQQMLSRALEWLAPKPSETVFDFFSGAGNFSLAMATRANKVFAYEVSDNMVLRCNHNARINKISNVVATKANLDAEQALNDIELSDEAVIVLDPARSGAKKLVEKLAKSKANRILYVSCNPNTFIRDVGLMESTFRIEKICTLDMFPFTEHIEVMALLVRRE